MSQSSRYAVNSRDEDHENYENRLRILIINFLRDINIPFSVVENPNFQEIINHLDPSIKPPTFTSLLEMAAGDHEQLVTQNEIRRKNDDIRPSTQLNPSEFCYGNRRFPLNLKELPTQADLDGIGNNAADIALPNSPCIICLKRQSWTKLRTLTMNETSVFLYVCVSQGVYTLKFAQKIYALKMLKCCSEHLMPVLEAALEMFGIENPDELSIVPDRVLADAQAIVKSIKDAKYGTTRKGECRDRYVGPFRNSLKCFFKNYLPRNTMLGGYVAAKPYCVSKIRRKEQVPQETVQPEPQLTQYQPYVYPSDELEFPDDFLEADAEDYTATSSMYSTIENL